MNEADLDYELPRELIAQEPAEPRDSARLMVVERRTGAIRHRVFRDLPELLEPEDCLVANDTRVLPARLLGKRRTGGKWEGLYLGQVSDGRWRMICKGRARPGESILLEDGSTTLKLLERASDGTWLVEPPPGTQPLELLERLGHVPLPPYIKRPDRPEDRLLYQTVFAKKPGSVAAPTASLHFTPELVQRIKEKGIGWVEITLHVGPGTFKPIKGPLEKHRLEAEWAEISEEAVKQIEARRAAGGRIVAVGTTVVRTLETAARLGKLRPWRGLTELFIKPPFDFKIVDALITNFHLPRTTLLALVYAFGGTELIKRAYQEAIRLRYRFYSYGDAMLIL